MANSMIPLIHPIYLDIPMLVSFAAATQGGLSFGAEVTSETAKAKSSEAKIAGKFGISNLFSSLFEASVDTEAGLSRSEEGRETRREAKSHTEASIAILLYDHLKKSDGYITTPSSSEEFSKIEPGTLVEITGTMEKNTIDWVIDFIDAVSILGELNAPPAKPRKNGRKTKTGNGDASPSQQISLVHMRDVMLKDRERTPISNAVLRCSEPTNLNAVVTLRTANLRDLTLSELNKNTVRVVGKVTRTISDGETMSAFENYGFSLLKPKKLREIFSEMSQQEELVADFTDVEVHGPAIQILPLMIFV